MNNDNIIVLASLIIGIALGVAFSRPDDKYHLLYEPNTFFSNKNDNLQLVVRLDPIEKKIKEKINIDYINIDVKIIKNGVDQFTIKDSINSLYKEYDVKGRINSINLSRDDKIKIKLKMKVGGGTKFTSYNKGNSLISTLGYFEFNYFFEREFFYKNGVLKY